MQKNIHNILIIFLLTTCTAVGQVVIEKPQLFKRASPFERYTTYLVSARAGFGMPMGSFKTYMSEPTLHNFGLALELVFPKNNLSAGLSVGSQYFMHRLPREVINYDNGAISAVQTRTFTAYPIVLTGSYHLAPVMARVRPYIQAGAGVAFADLTNYLGAFPTGDNGFKFVAQGGAGIKILFKKDGKLGLDAIATYRHLPFKVASEGITDASSLNLQAGIFYRWW